MVNLLHPQSIVSHLNRMKVYGEANFHDFWNKRLFYVLFFRPTSVYVAGGSTLSASGMGFITVMFPGSTTLH